MTPLHAQAQYICIVYAKYQKASVKALVYKLTSPCMHYLSKSKTSKFTKLSFCQKLIFWHKTTSCKCSMCLYYAGKVSDSFSKSSGTSRFLRACTIWALTKPLLRSKVLKEWHCHFCQKIFLWHQTSSCKCSMCVHCVCKVSDGLSKSSGTSWFSPCMYYLSNNKTLIKKQCKKWLSSKRCHFVFMQMSNVSTFCIKTVEQVEFPIYALPMHH